MRSPVSLYIQQTAICERDGEAEGYVLGLSIGRLVLEFTFALRNWRRGR